MRSSFELFLCVLTLLSLASEISSFITLPHKSTWRAQTPSNADSTLYAWFRKKSRKEPDPEPQGPRSWATRNDFRTFLNQCTIQSFMFLLRQLRDVQTVMWVEEFTRPTVNLRTSDMAMNEENFMSGGFVEPALEEEKKTSVLLRYHGLGAMNTTAFPTWDTYFRDLLKLDNEVYYISSEKAHIPNYELEINPASLCTRMISVREQIAREWAGDLSVIARMSGEMMTKYFRALKDQQEAGISDDQIIVERQNLFFLEWDPYEDSGYAPSPLRKGNFDLLVLQTTQEAIHRILNDPDSQKGAAAVTNKFLEDFYTERMVSHFVGSQRYARADDFLNDLIATPPKMVSAASDATSLIDPLRVAEMILEKREEVALEWKEIATAVPNEHFDIRRLMLNRLIGISYSRGAETS